MQILQQKVEHVIKYVRRKRRMKKRVMTVDDEPDVTYCLKACLEETGLVQVDGYVDPFLALAKFKPSTFDLVILDIRMPVMNGFQLYQKLKSIDDDVKVCFLTAVHDLSDYKEAYPDIIDAIENDEMKCFLDKPVGSEQLRTLVKNIIN
ncbi:MAG: response regulator [Nitrososphaeraceae archaeon]|jgi:two-component system, OmpR family, response regulator ChvI|nr:response regulator [Nitrososphaeraceae archaeon]